MRTPHEADAVCTTPINERSTIAPNTPRIEAYGVKGMQSRPWRRIFKHSDALAAWCEKNDAEVHGTRNIVDG